jgi:hypothetical protein
MRGGGEGGAARARESQEEGENGARREVAGRRDDKSRGGIGGAVINREWPASLARFMFMGVAQQGIAAEAVKRSSYGYFQCRSRPR